MLRLGHLRDASSHQRAKRLVENLRRMDSIGLQRSGGVSCRHEAAWRELRQIERRPGSVRRRALPHNSGVGVALTQQALCAGRPGGCGSHAAGRINV